MVKFTRESAAAAATAAGDGRSGGGKGTEIGHAAAERGGGEGEQDALCISSLPLLLEGHSPVGEGLPMFLLRLAMEVGVVAVVRVRVGVGVGCICCC